MSSSTNRGLAPAGESTIGRSTTQSNPLNHSPTFPQTSPALLGIQAHRLLVCLALCLVHLAILLLGFQVLHLSAFHPLLPLPNQLLHLLAATLVLYHHRVPHLVSQQHQHLGTLPLGIHILGPHVEQEIDYFLPVTPETVEKLESISGMQDKSHEELRWEDYQLGNHGGRGFGQFSATSNQISFSQPAPFFSTPFQASQPILQTSPSVFSSFDQTQPGNIAGLDGSSGNLCQIE